MYLSAQEIAAHRNRTLSNLLGLTTACFEAGQRLNNLIAAAGRDAMHHGSRQLMAASHDQIDAMGQAPVNFWLAQSIRQGRLLDQACQIAGHAHKALIEGAEAQLRIVDDILLTGIRRGEKSSPWEVELALGALRHSLESAEKSLHEISRAATDSVERVEQEIHDIAESLDEGSTTKKAPSQRARARQA